MTQYATLSELYTYGAPQRAFGSLSDDDKNAALNAASRILDTYFAGRFALPLTAWDVATTEATCRIAAYNLLNVRGYNPASGADVNIIERYKQAIEWCVRVQKQQAHPQVTPQPSQTPTYEQPFVISSSVVNLGTGGKATNRGW